LGAASVSLTAIRLPAVTQPFGTVSVTRAAWHLAAASTGPDERVAALLEAAAASALQRSAYAAAARAFEAAAVLSAADTDRLRRMVGAGRALWLSGDPDRAGTVLAGALEFVTDPLVRAQMQMLRGATMLFTRPVAETYSLLIAEAERTAASLFQSTKTVEFHLSNTYRKLGVRSRAELVRRVDGLT
jgi:hypothetical protein